MIMLMTPPGFIDGLQGMDLLQAAMNYHLGSFGPIFIAVILWLFSFSTFIGILFYARPNVAYLFGDNWLSQTLYKILALIMLFIGCLAAYTFVWDLGDVGVGLMTIFNLAALFPLAPKALSQLKEYEAFRKKRKRRSCLTNDGINKDAEGFLTYPSASLCRSIVMLFSASSLQPRQ